MKVFHEKNLYFKNEFPVREAISKNINFLAHWHNEVEIVYVISGPVKVGINNELRELSKDNIAICGSRDIHFYESNDKYSEVLILIFKPEIIGYPGGWPEKECLCEKFITPSCLNKIDDENFIENIHNDMFEIFTELDEKKPQYESLIKSKLFDICGNILRYIPTYNQNTTQYSSQYFYIDRMQDVLKFIESNYTENINLNDAAKVANLSISHFSRIFNSIVGKSFTSYVNILRVSRAEQMLKENDINISDIAFQCGFESIRTFNRVFKQYKGTPPSYNR